MTAASGRRPPCATTPATNTAVSPGTTRPTRAEASTAGSTSAATSTSNGGRPSSTWTSCVNDDPLARTDAGRPPRCPYPAACADHVRGQRSGRTGRPHPRATALSAVLVGDLGPKFADVRRIAVLRGGGIGDLMFVLPAVESLVAAYPGAEVTLLGMPSHAALLADRPAPFAAVEVLPGHPGVREGAPVDPDVTEAFFARMRARSFNLAVQAHGGGGNSNPFLLRLGARHTIGTAAPGAPRLERDVAYRYFQHETQRWLEVAALAGAPAVQLEARLRGRVGRRPRVRGVAPQ